MSKGKLKELLLSIYKQDGKIFSVIFKKRTTGETRKMICRRGVKKHLKGGKLAYSPKEHSLLTVFDMQKKDYRMINCDSVEELHFHGEVYKAKNND